VVAGAFLVTSEIIGKTIPHRDCDKCDAEMTHLGDVIASLGGVPVRVFRRYNCDHVVSESW
jgi:hypothetical protein